MEPQNGSADERDRRIEGTWPANATGGQCALPPRAGAPHEGTWPANATGDQGQSLMAQILQWMWILTFAIGDWGTWPANATGGQCALPPRAGAPHEGTWPANATGDQDQSLMAQILQWMWILTFAIGDWGELNDRRLRKANDKKGEGKMSGASSTDHQIEKLSLRASKLKTWQERRKFQIEYLAQKPPDPDEDSSGGENRTSKILAIRRGSVPGALTKTVRGAGSKEELQTEKLTQKLPGPDAGSSDGENTTSKISEGSGPGALTLSMNWWARWVHPVASLVVNWVRKRCRGAHGTPDLASF